MSQNAYRTSAAICAAAACVGHVAGLALPMFPAKDPGGPTGLQAMSSTPALVLIELLALSGVVAYAAAVLWRTSMRRQTGIGVFTGSLALALAAPALLLPAGAARAGAGHPLFGGGHPLELARPLPGFWVWALSLPLIGLALHLVTVARWHASGQQAVE